MRKSRNNINDLKPGSVWLNQSTNEIVRIISVVIYYNGTEVRFAPLDSRFSRVTMWNDFDRHFTYADPQRVVKWRQKQKPK